jgi:hypothetical protein
MRRVGLMATKAEKLTELYKRASILDESLPAQLMDKLSIYGQILELLGGFHASSVEAWKLAEATRRETIASAMVYGAELEGAEAKTAKDREAIAEVVGAKARAAEGKAEAEATRWKNAYNSTIEQINIMKKRYDHLVNVFQKGGI